MTSFNADLNRDINNRTPEKNNQFLTVLELPEINPGFKTLFFIFGNFYIWEYIRATMWSKNSQMLSNEVIITHEIVHDACAHVPQNELCKHRKI